MNRKKAAGALIFLVILCGCLWAEVREPAVAGVFYPADKKELKSTIEHYFSQMNTEPVGESLAALIVPHAAYQYSGQVAAYAYKELKGRRYKRVVLIGPTHYFAFDGISVGDYDAYRTPLGEIAVDKEFADALIRFSSKINFVREAEKKEYCLEVQLPFLQTSLHDFKIVPIIIGDPSQQNIQLLAAALSALADDQTLIVVSSDLSHYYPYDKAVEMDKLGISAIMKDDPVQYIRYLSEKKTEACGAGGIITLLLLSSAIGGNNVKLLKYQNSGDVTGDKSAVVGYASIGFYETAKKLTNEEKRALLVIARETLESGLGGKNIPPSRLDYGGLSEKKGIFVTLLKKGELRGCIGYIHPVKPLYEAVKDMAIEAAARDPRFPPVSKEELNEIRIEVSVLSKMHRIEDPAEIKIGRDGLFIIARGRSGILLPQVAAENNWGASKFLENVCCKAGLPENAWKDKDAALYRFSAEVFGE